MSDPTIECGQVATVFGSSLFTALALFLAILVAVVRWKDVFRSDLRKRQLEELATVRRQLHDVWLQFYYLPFTRGVMETSSWNFDDLREHAPDEWEGYMLYSTCSRSLFRKLQSPNYFLFPRWLDTKEVASLKSAMSDFAPFTLLSSTVLVTTENCAFLATENCALDVAGTVPVGEANGDGTARDARLGDQDAIEALSRAGDVEGGVVAALRREPANDPLLDRVGATGP